MKTTGLAASVTTLSALTYLLFAIALLIISFVLRRKKNINRWILIFCAALFVVAAILTLMSAGKLQ